jgi:hypothetical protein
VGLSCNKERGL